MKRRNSGLASAAVLPLTGLLVLLSGCLNVFPNIGGSEKTAVETVFVYPFEATVKENETFQLTAAVYPADAEDKSIVWSSSDPGKAAVNSSGLVTGIAPGTVLISAVSTNGKYGSATVIVAAAVTIPKPATGIGLDQSSLSLGIGQTGTLSAALTPADSTDEVTWISSDPLKVSVSGNGKTAAVTGKAQGTATITAAAGKYSASCVVTVYGQGGSGGLTVNFSGFGDETIDLTVNGTAALSAGISITIIPPAGYDYYVWFADDSSLGSYGTPNSLYFDGIVWHIDGTNWWQGISISDIIGKHEVTLICEKGGRAYSKSVTFTVGY